MSGVSVSRRAVMMGGVGLVVAGCTASPAGPPASSVTGSSAARTTTTTTAPMVGTNGPLVVDVQRQSAARGKTVRVIAMFPTGAVERLPTFLALHGRGADAGQFLDLGVPQLLASAVHEGVAPFAVLAVDGGDSYWVARDPGDDPQRMLIEEVPGWLTELGLIEYPFGAIGISMGGYGALNYARRTPGPPSIAVLSPALFTSWPDARARNAFADEAAWQATEPLRHLGDLFGALGVWCGTTDPFLPATKKLIAALHPDGAITAGGHDSAYWHRTLPDVLRFLGGKIR